jgi:hypothetical protein
VGQGRQAEAGLFPFCGRTYCTFPLVFYSFSNWMSQAIMKMKEITTECIKQNHLFIVFVFVVVVNAASLGL